MLRAGALLAVVLAAIGLNVVDVSAKTLTNSAAKPAPALSAAAQALARERAKACSAYGAGFVQFAGTDACIKIGGSITTDATGIGN